MRSRITFGFLAAFMLAATAFAGDDKDDDKKKLPPTPSVTSGEVTIGGQVVPYTASAGFMRLTTYEGKDRADVFYIAYTKGAPAAAEPKKAEEEQTRLGEPGHQEPGHQQTPHQDPTRPIIFAFNGGPGSSSVWLHMGSLGPKRIKMGPEGEPLGPPYEVVDNAESWLDVADLVFIDPVSTGFSRPVEGQDPKQFHGLEEDAAAVADFIRLYTTKHGRWLSPKFLCGESYGTTRAATLSQTLQDSHGMYLNGIILVSPVLNFQTLRFAEGNDTAFWLYVPAYTATAWYHGKMPGTTLEAALAESEEFAMGEYVRALARGDAMSEQEARAVRQKLARLCGVSPEFVARTRDRIEIGEFTKELLREQSRTVGRLDSRYTGIDRDDQGRGFEFDPSYAAILGPYTAAINDYVRQTLKFESDLPYEILTGRVHPWSYPAQNEFMNVGERLRSAMSKNRNLRVLVASGYYDLATPYFAAKYTIDHLGLDASLRGNITWTKYRAGHMMYVRDEDRAGLKRDVAQFVRESLTTRNAEGTPPAPPK